MRVIVIKPFQVWVDRILPVSEFVVDIDDPIAKRGIINGFLKPVDKEDIENFKYLESKKIKTKDKEKKK